MTQRIFFIIALLGLVGCGAAAPAVAVTPPSPSTRAAQVMCLERLDVDETYAVVRTMVPAETDVVADRATNCYVLIGDADAEVLATVIEHLEGRGRFQHRPEPVPSPPRTASAVD